jgi:hypothetical protein
VFEVGLQRVAPALISHALVAGDVAERFVGLTANLLTLDLSQERERAFDVARRELDGLIVLPERARAAIERGIAGELDS